MPDTKKQHKQQVRKMVTDSSHPLELKKSVLMDLVSGNVEHADEILVELLDSAADPTGKQQYLARKQQYEEALQEMQKGPLRTGTFIELCESTEHGCRAEVLLSDGTTAICFVPERTVAQDLRIGDDVWLEANGRALLHYQKAHRRTGEEARIERTFPDGTVEVRLRDERRYVYFAAEKLHGELEAGTAGPGSTALVCTQRRIAFQALPEVDGVGHLRFLARQPVPDVWIESHVGSPPPFLAEIVEHVRMELEEPGIGRRYGRRRSQMRLLTGVSGSGKTLCIQALWRSIYEETSRITGADLEDLPHRVIRVRASQVFSKWLGESDKNVDRLFDEIEEVASGVYVAPDGREWILPTLVVFEEIDGIARTRGGDEIHDRILTTFLQRLDTTSQKLADLLVICLFTTNVPDIVDPAFLRRSGGKVERFGRLDRRGFQSVLEKHLAGRPFSTVTPSGVFADEDEARAAVCADLAAWLFAPDRSSSEGRGQVEISLVGRVDPLVKRRRDFLTGGLVDRAVQESLGEAARAEYRGEEHPGLTLEALARAFDAQVRAIVEQLSPENAASYVDLPEGARVSAVRALEQMPVLPLELERAS